MKVSLNKNSGITLLEVLIAVTISTFVLMAAVATYRSQAVNHLTQEQIVNMHQNARTALNFMERDFRMAAFDPTTLAGAQIITADISQLQFQIDDDEDGIIEPGNTDEMISYALLFDGDGNGICEAPFCDLGRGNVNQVPGVFTAANLPPLAENIDALNFVYLDKFGNVLSAPVLNPVDIATIQVTIVARSGRFVPANMMKFTDNTVYRNQQGQIILPAQNDSFRRIMLTTNIRCRNSNYN